ncbi:MAG: hypothetical protein GF311_22870 [Candidatus Lokiarchaeota archaeon]|nr:hypothetical protein [Candidatus Lokiarchaeota archaeon]
MDKKRTLKITHPRLRTLRDNLRNVIVKEVYKRLHELRKEIRKYPIEDAKNRIPLIREKQTLKCALDASICKCSKCTFTTSDMIHNPFDKNWYCISCYEKAHEWYKTHPHSTESRNAPNPFP